MKTIKQSIKFFALFCCITACSSSTQSIDLVGIWNVQSITSGDVELVSKNDGLFLDFRASNILYGGDGYGFSKGSWKTSSAKVELIIDGDTITGVATYLPDSTLEIKGNHSDGSPAVMKMVKNKYKGELGVLVAQVYSPKRYPDKTVTEAVNGFFSEPKWESFFDVEIEGFYVNMKGGMTFDGKPVDALLQFKVTSIFDCEISAFEMNGVPQNELMLVGLLEKMFE
ncbi:MAG: hypothetical protein JW894_12155 [Bacteroidales bacterium]|nr:hypothetical protein [Bacteroidales bacterium]